MVVGWSIIMKDLVRPPLLHCYVVYRWNVVQIYWLVWRLVYSQDLFVVLIALMFCNAEHQILQRPARFRECVGEWLGSLREYFWFLFKFKIKIKGMVTWDEIEKQFKVSFRKCIKAQILRCFQNSRMERVQRHRLRVFESVKFSSCWKLAAG